MPIEFEIRAEHELVFSRWTGHVGDSDLAEAALAIVEIADQVPDFNRVVDLRSVDVRGITASAINMAVGLINTKRRMLRARTAFIANDALSYALARMYQMWSYNKPRRIMVFRDHSEAAKWLGCPVDLLEPRPISDEA